jgi:hypothetical protein
MPAHSRPGLTSEVEMEPEADGAAWWRAESLRTTHHRRTSAVLGERTRARCTAQLSSRREQRGEVWSHVLVHVQRLGERVIENDPLLNRTRHVRLLKDDLN